LDPRDLKSMIDILGLPYDVDFSESDVESSYKFRARLYHPDMNKTKNAHAKFIELNNARDYVISI